MKLTHLILLLSVIMITMNARIIHAQSSIDTQIAELRQTLAGKKIGFLTNPTSVDAQYTHLADRLHADAEIDLVCFFAPEHGLRGDNQAGGGDGDYTDPVTGLPVYTLYGARQAPTPEQLDPLDAVLYDIQDVGTRFYTYVWTMTHAMEAAAAAGKEFYILDRPNPIGLNKVEGAPVTFDSGLIGRKWPNAPFGVPTRHGMTAGELATLVNEEWMDPKVTLTVIKVPGYTRDMDFEETGYPWVMPSPNMPTRETALVYPGMGIFEGSDGSEGRGTTRPFEFCGAPYVNGWDLAQELNKSGLPGVRFRAAAFTPMFDDYQGQACGGVQLHVTDPETFMPVRTGMTVLKTVFTLYPEDATITNWASRLMGVPDLHERLKTESVESIEAGWQDNLSAFLELRAQHALYPAGTENGMMLH